MSSSFYSLKTQLFSLLAEGPCDVSYVRSRLDLSEAAFKNLMMLLTDYPFVWEDTIYINGHRHAMVGINKEIYNDFAIRKRKRD